MVYVIKFINIIFKFKYESRLSKFNNNFLYSFAKFKLKLNEQCGLYLSALITFIPNKGNSCPTEPYVVST